MKIYEVQMTDRRMVSKGWRIKNFSVGSSIALDSYDRVVKWGHVENMFYIRLGPRVFWYTCYHPHWIERYTTLWLDIERFPDQPGAKFVFQILIYDRPYYVGMRTRKRPWGWKTWGPFVWRTI